MLCDIRLIGVVSKRKLSAFQYRKERAMFNSFRGYYSPLVDSVQAFMSKITAFGDSPLVVYRTVISSRDTRSFVGI